MTTQLQTITDADNDSPMLNNTTAINNSHQDENDETPSVQPTDSENTAMSDHSNSQNPRENSNASPELKTIEEKEQWLEQNRQNIMQNGCRIVSECYKYLNVISEGVYGVVHRAQCMKTGDIVALKKIKVHKTRSGFPQSSLREISILCQLRHENIISVREVVIDKDYVDVFMVMDYAANDIQSIMHNNNKRSDSKQKWHWPLDQCKCLMYQLLDGLKYLHSMFILHRDLKTSNLLLSNRGVLKICDFGMARPFTMPLEQMTNYVVTLWYRSPELLLATNNYGPPIDVWSVGCIFAEFLTGEVLFGGAGEFQQINLIFALLGTPTEAEWPDYPNLPHGPNKFPWRIMKRKIDDKFPTKKIEDKQDTKEEDNKPILCTTEDLTDTDTDTKMNGHSNTNTELNNGHDVKMKQTEQKHSDDVTSSKENEKNTTEKGKETEKMTFTEYTVDLLKKLLIYDPAKRITAEQALQHHFFTTELPKMTDKAEMPKFEEHHVKHTRHETRPDDVGEQNKTNEKQDVASC